MSPRRYPQEARPCQYRTADHRLSEDSSTPHTTSPEPTQRPARPSRQRGRNWPENQNRNLRSSAARHSPCGQPTAGQRCAWNWPALRKTAQLVKNSPDAETAAQILRSYETAVPPMPRGQARSLDDEAWPCRRTRRRRRHDNLSMQRASNGRNGRMRRHQESQGRRAIPRRTEAGGRDRSRRPVSHGPETAAGSRLKNRRGIFIAAPALRKGATTHDHHHRLRL